MSKEYSQDASADMAEDKLSSAIASLRGEIKSEKPQESAGYEEIPDTEEYTEVEIEGGDKKEPHRTEFVETDDPKVLARINDLYGQVKKSDTRNQMIIQHNQMLEAKLAEALERMDKTERTYKDTQSNNVESEIKTKLKAAREDGDYDTVDKLENDLLELKLERRLADKFPKIQEKTPQQQALTPEQEQAIKAAYYVESLSQERDAQGNFVRPYLYDWHPDNEKASKMAESIRGELLSAGKTPDAATIMRILDDRMLKKPSATRGVPNLRDDMGVNRDKTTIKLTAQEVNIARKMGITPESYAKQKALLNR